MHRLRVLFQSPQKLDGNTIVMEILVKNPKSCTHLSATHTRIRKYVRTYVLVRRTLSNSKKKKIPKDFTMSMRNKFESCLKCHKDLT